MQFKPVFYVRAFLFIVLSVALAAQPSNSVKITDKSGTAQANRPFTISRVFAKGDIPHFAQAVVGGVAVTTQCDVKTRWPDGSVQHALISFVASVGASATITVGFTDQPTGNNSGAMNQAAMVAANWGAEIDVTNGTTQSANARSMLSAGSWSYWLQGPICTQVIIEDRSQTLAYDMGWDTYKPLHPIFVVTFYPGYSGTRVEMILENMWTTKLEDQTYSLNLQTGNPLTSVYSRTNFTEPAETRWRKTFWVGATPGAVNIDYNLPYMIYSQAVPNWDLSKVVPSGTFTADISSFTASDQGDLLSNGSGGHALWTQNMPQTGGRPEIGVFPAWYVRYLYTMEYNMYNVMLGLAQVSAYVPMHTRESSTGTSGRYYNASSTISPFGYPLSIDARPTWTPLNAGSLAVGADKITCVKTCSSGGWTWDLAHEGAFAYIPYLITGDWYFLEELQFQASTALALSDSGFNPWSRGGSWGYINAAIQTRGQAWGLRDLVEAAFMSPDGTPQKAYFTDKLNNNIHIEEGEMNVTNGSFPPANASCPGYTAGPSADRWCFGRMTVGGNMTNPLYFPNQGDQYGGGCAGTNGSGLVTSGPYLCFAGESPFEYGFKFNVSGHIQELSFPIASLNQMQFKFLLHLISDPAVNPYITGIYKMPVILQSTMKWYQNWSDVMNGIGTSLPCGSTTLNLQTYQGWSGNCPGAGSGDSNVTAPGYPHIMKGAASYLVGLNVNDGALGGVAAWNWMVANVGYQNSVGVNPQFAILPRSPAVSQCDLNMDGVVDVQDVQLSINEALGMMSCGGGLTGSGTCTVVEVQRVVNAALGGSCRLGP